VKIEFVETQPATAWNLAAPSEYGFYSNVNPEVDYPRWSQRKERLLPAFFADRETQKNSMVIQMSHRFMPACT